jgi:hypothetical protein
MGSAGFGARGCGCAIIIGFGCGLVGRIGPSGKRGVVFGGERVEAFQQLVELGIEIGRAGQVGGRGVNVELHAEEFRPSGHLFISQLAGGLGGRCIGLRRGGIEQQLFEKLLG